MPPVMTERVEAEAFARSAKAECADAPHDCVRSVDETADFIWAAEAYFQYIESLRSSD